jgi:hypothetical protein
MKPLSVFDALWSIEGTSYSNAQRPLEIEEKKEEDEFEISTCVTRI